MSPLTGNSKIGDELYLFCSNSSHILDLSVKFASQICHENTNTPLDGAYLADFGIDIEVDLVCIIGSALNIRIFRLGAQITG